MNSTSLVHSGFLDQIAKKYDLDLETVKEEVAEWPSQTMSLRQFFVSRSLLSERQFQESLAEYVSLDFVEDLPELEPEKMELFVKSIPSRFAYQGVFFPILWEKGCITFAVVDLSALQECDRIAENFMHEAKIVLSLENSILNLIQKKYQLGETTESLQKEEEEFKSLDMSNIAEGEDILAQEDEEPIRQLVNHILFRALQSNSSDVHIDPSSDQTIVRNRIDGMLVKISTIPKLGHSRVVNRVKIMAGLDISTRNLPQDGRSMLKIGGKKVDVRVSILPTIFGERVVMRLLQQSHHLLTLNEVGLNEGLETKLNAMVQKPNGIILVTGPTGSGKTTTLYACLQSIDHEARNIITVEDPVEYQMAGYGQVQVNEKQGLTFPVGLRSILRQDPDVIMIGEIRDSATAQIAIQSALTGHLVLSTLHTNDSVSTVVRLIDMGIEPFLISSTLQCVMAQRLVRQVCPQCAKKKKISFAELLALGCPGYLKNNYRGFVYESNGCQNCFMTGYKGRIAVHELLEVSEAVKEEIINHPTSSSLLQKAQQSNAIFSLTEDCFYKVVAGLTTIREVSRVIYEFQHHEIEQEN